MATKSIRRARLITLVFGVIILAAVAVNWFAFRFFGRNYFFWYLENGAVISLAAAFLAPTWTKLKARIALVSPQPAAYVGACLQVAGVHILATAPLSEADARAAEIDDPRSARTHIENSIELGDTRLIIVLDDLIYPLIAIVMTLLALAWVIVVAPLSYFVNLIAGVPARQALRGRLHRPKINEKDGRVTANEPAAIPGERLSFAQDPFAMTQALTSLILFVANLVYPRIVAVLS